MDILTLAMAKAYTDRKAGYSEPGKVLGSGAIDDGWYEGAPTLGLVLGKTYIVSLDDETYTVVCNDAQGFIGFELLDGYVADSIGVSSGTGWMADGFPDHSHITISTPETIHPIDPKYLPGVCLPVVEIADYTALTDAECAALDKAESNNAPIVVKFNFGGIDICCALSRMDAEGITIFSGTQLLLEATWKIVLSNEGGWTMTITE